MFLCLYGISSYILKICGGSKPYLSPNLLNSENLRCQKEAFDLFHSTRKMGGEEFSRIYLTQLEEEIEVSYDSLLKHNAAKNIYTGFRTPVVIFAAVVVLYILSALVGAMGLEMIGNLLNIIMLLLLGVVATWTYTRATGNYPEVGKTIDSAAAFVHGVRTTILFSIIIVVRHFVCQFILK